MVTHSTHPDPLTREEQAIVALLTRWSSVSPVSLDVLENHFQETDPNSWRIIQNRLIQSSKTDVLRILSRIGETPGLQYSITSLVALLLKLSKWSDLEARLHGLN